MQATSSRSTSRKEAVGFSPSQVIVEDLKKQTLSGQCQVHEVIRNSNSWGGRGREEGQGNLKTSTEAKSHP